ncbi:hypothetical protein EDM54_04220 [Brevibacillus borstelensis]|nr:hypothetical protein X546_01065 [Brevibacillus borstelensis cifa_chp40]RNB65126.1 hypothetical protein EDM54_04220 [Brevibacillus borstelensis]GED53291.1 hypothetical protein BBO01nite_25320 [Brevibacillus borstelensis]
MSQAVGQQEAIQVQMSSCPPENSAHYENMGNTENPGSAGDPLDSFKPVNAANLAEGIGPGIFRPVHDGAGIRLGAR